MDNIVIIGGGLAGMCAALQAHKNYDKNIIVVEKEKQLGGNSAKASSGVSALNTEDGDTPENYKQDTIKSGDGNSNPDLVATLVDGSEEAIKFLQELGLDMSVIVKLGGHRYSRTHSCPSGPVGWMIVKTLMDQIQKNTKIEAKTNTQVTNIELGSDGEVAGLTVNDGEFLQCGAIVLATGGYAASKQKLEEWCPSAAEFATTNGSWATGDGVQLGKTIGAGVVDLDQVQIHPTGFIDPNDPNNATKFLAPEKLRGCGAVMLNNKGKRFVDELQLRIVVTKAVMQQEGQTAWILLTEAAANKFGIHAIGFYMKKGLIQKVERTKIAETIGCENDTIEQEFDKYSQAKKAGVDEFGKSTFPVDLKEEGGGDEYYYLMKVVPVVHYCMGGLKINTHAQVLDQSNNYIPGLFAAGEVTGGLHGKNRLAGNSLLECIVFGRIAGEESAKFVTNKLSAQENIESN